MRFDTAPCVALSACVVAWSALFFLLENIFSRTPYTMFRRGNHVLVRGEQRKRDACVYLLSPEVRQRDVAPYRWLNETAPSKTNINTNATVGRDNAAPEWCIGIASVWRAHEQYVHFTVGALLDTVTEAERRHMHVVLYLADVDPTQQLYNARRRGLDRVVDTVLLRGDPGNANDTHGGQDPLPRAEWLLKESEDYANILDYCTRSVPSARYVVVLEDDVVATGNWPRMLREVLSEIDADLTADPAQPVIESIAKKTEWEEKALEAGLADSADSTSSLHGSDILDRRWLYLRLFYTEVFDGFGMHSVPQFALLVLAALALQTVLWFGVVPRSSRHKLTSSWLRRLTTLAYFLSLPTATVLVPVIIGRQNIFPQPRGLTRELLNTWGTPALLFPRMQAARLSALLHHSIREFRKSAATYVQPIDLFIEEAGDAEGSVRYTWTPSPFQHIGGTSSATYGEDADDTRTRFNSLSYERAERAERGL